MSPDNYRFLIIKTTKEGRATVEAASDDLQAIEKNFLYLCNVYDEEIESGLFRLDIYDICTEAA